jgi:hypothetical protein
MFTGEREYEDDDIAGLENPGAIDAGYVLGIFRLQLD